MVRVDFWTAQEDPDGELIATVIAERRQRPQVTGSQSAVVKLDDEILSVSTGELISWQQDPEEWARSLPASYRGPGLLAQLTYDDAQGGAVKGDAVVEEPLIIKQRARD